MPRTSNAACMCTAYHRTAGFSAWRSAVFPCADRHLAGWIRAASQVTSDLPFAAVVVDEHKSMYKSCGTGYDRKIYHHIFGTTALYGHKTQDTMASEDTFSILTPNAMLGYGYRQDHFWYGVEQYKPAAIIVDSGSTDGGPYKLGMNRMTCGRESYERDLSSILEACFHHKIKILVGSAGGDGSNSHVDEMLSIVEDISEAKGYSFKIATIKTDISRDLIKQRVVGGKSSPCGPLESLKTDDVDTAVEIVGQMGAEPSVHPFTTVLSQADASSDT